MSTLLTIGAILCSNPVMREPSSTPDLYDNFGTAELLAGHVASPLPALAPPAWTTVGTVVLVINLSGEVVYFFGAGYAAYIIDAAAPVRRMEFSTKTGSAGSSGFIIRMDAAATTGIYFVITNNLALSKIDVRPYNWSDVPLAAAQSFTAQQLTTYHKITVTDDGTDIVVSLDDNTATAITFASITDYNTQQYGGIFSGSATLTSWKDFKTWDSPALTLTKQGIVTTEFPRNTWDVMVYAGGVVQAPDDSFIMVYTAYTSITEYGPAIATSTDLINWTKPNIGEITYLGNTNNNLVVTHDTHVGADMIYDSGKYYLFVNNSPGHSNWIYESVDGGIADHWTYVPPAGAFPVGGANNLEVKTVIWVPADGVFRAYFTSGHETEMRSLSYSEAATINGSWSARTNVAEFQATGVDDQFYDIKVFWHDGYMWAVVNKYRTSDTYLGPLQMWKSNAGGVTGSWTLEGTLVDFGGVGDWDERLLTVAKPVLFNGVWYLHYVGSDSSHGTWPRNMDFGLATGPTWTA